MPALSFNGKPERGPFYQLILDEEKTITTRKLRKHPIKEGDNLKFYWKQRVPEKDKPVHLIGEAECIRAGIYPNMRSFLLSLGGKEAVRYVSQEGFDNLGELASWWTGEEVRNYGIMNGCLLFSEDIWIKLGDSGPVQVIEWGELK